MTQESFRIAFVLLPKFSSLTLSSLVEPLRIANYCDGSELYEWSYLSTNGEPVPGCSGYSVNTVAINDELSDKLDAVIICGGWNAERYDDPELERWLRLIARRNVILGAAELGAYVLAHAGLLTGYAMTIHWHCRNAFIQHRCVLLRLHGYAGRTEYFRYQHRICYRKVRQCARD